MTAQQKLSLRARAYTYYEMLAFAQFFHEHRTENSPENILLGWLKWKEVKVDLNLTERKLLAIEQICVGYYGLDLQDVRGSRRYTELVRCRQVIAYFSVRFASQHTAARTLGGKRDNLQYGKTKCAQLMEVEPLLRKEVADVERRIAEALRSLDDEQQKQISETINTNENEQHEQQQTDRS
jgi:hypothetical protein